MSMEKTSVFYYTNNVAPPKLLESTLRATLKHCADNRCELILTSHYPLTEHYETHYLGNQAIEPSITSLYNYIVKDVIINDEELRGVDIKSYVVGKMPYSYESIMRQILFSLEKCNGQNIIFMEHDCFYPETYIKTIEKFLVGQNKNLTHCIRSVFLNEKGYFRTSGGSFVLGTCAAKREIIKRVYERKMELIANSKNLTFEPLLDTAPVSKRNSFREEIIVKNHVCIDAFLEGCVLDIKHHLNADGFLTSNNCAHSHPYWGEDTKYIEMLRSVKVGEEDQKLWSCGIGKLNY